ncbi:11684_t:CDS:2 [Ambispora gerdemannii]|uniref:11684_t:CDS:1 n=1 Tax=Ambispora gerdemannii TaxID=144530 RepID=A0A9N8VW43_9GLOM|nr:11684_t:CDS:2 [Ambispora gerdemannii]
MQQRQLHSENHKKEQSVPCCFCNLVASVAYSDRGVIYECHYRHVNPWQQALNPPFENDCLSRRQTDIRICAFHVHAKPWFEMLSKADRPNQHKELSKCAYFNLTFCVLFNINNTFAKRYLFAPKCNCGNPVVLDTSKSTGKLIFLCRNYCDISAWPRCSWSHLAENVRFDNTNFNIHPLITTNTTKLLENVSGNNFVNNRNHNSSSSDQNEFVSTSVTNYSPQNQRLPNHNSPKSNSIIVDQTKQSTNTSTTNNHLADSSSMNNTFIIDQEQNTLSKLARGKSHTYERNAHYPPESPTIQNFYSDQISSPSSRLNNNNEASCLNDTRQSQYEGNFEEKFEELSQYLNYEEKIRQEDEHRKLRKRYNKIRIENQELYSKQSTLSSELEDVRHSKHLHKVKNFELSEKVKALQNAVEEKKFFEFLRREAYKHGLNNCAKLYGIKADIRKAYRRIVGSFNRHPSSIGDKTIKENFQGSQQSVNDRSYCYELIFEETLFRPGHPHSYNREHIIEDQTKLGKSVKASFESFFAFNSNDRLKYMNTYVPVNAEHQYSFTG